MARPNPKELLRTARDAFAPAGTVLGAMLTALGTLQALLGLNPVGRDLFIVVGLTIFAVFGSWVIISTFNKVNEIVKWQGNEHAQSLWHDGIPAVHAEYFDRVRKGDYGTVQRFWSAGFVNVSDGYGTYDFHVACEAGHAAIVQGLLEKGADPRLPNRGGQTPLMLAAIEGRTKVAERLFDHDCALNARATGGGFSALHVAASHGHTRMVDLLIKEGAKVDSLDDEHLTPLMYAMAQHKWDVAELLLTAGADLSRVDASGATLMNYAQAFQAPAAIVDTLGARAISVCNPPLYYRGGGHSRAGHTRVRWQKEAPPPNPFSARGRQSPTGTLP